MKTIVGMISIFFFSLFPVTGQSEDYILEELHKIMEVEYFTYTIDDECNILVTGFYTDTAKIGNQQMIARGQTDIFFAKFDPSFDILWIKPAGGGIINFNKFISTDESNNIYITGQYKGLAYFQDTTLNSGYAYDQFYAKYTKDGELLWVKSR